MTAADVHYDRLLLMMKIVRERGQARVARELGYSAAVICQVAAGSYKGDVNKVLQRAAEVFGTETTSCPVLGTILLGRCAEERKRPFSAGSPLRLRLWKACRDCEKAL